MTADQTLPAVNLPNPDPLPYTNNGFTSGMNGKLGVPEWKMLDAQVTEGIIYLKKVDGTEIEYAIFDAALNKFILK